MKWHIHGDRKESNGCQGLGEQESGVTASGGSPFGVMRCAGVRLR